MGPPAIVVSGPSGVGKGTILSQVRAKYAGKLEYTVSHTTRRPRAGEEDGREYHFVSKDDFEQMINEGVFVEWARYSDNYYGTAYSEITRIQARGRICLIEIELNGVQQLQHKKLDARYVFLYPPSLQELEARLRARGTDSEDSIRKRLATARTELNLMQNTLHADHQIVNGDVAEAFADISRYIDDTIAAFYHA